MDQMLNQFQQALTPILMAAATAFIAWVFTQLRGYFHISSSDSAETAIRVAAHTAAGKLAAMVPAASSAAVIANPKASVASLFSPNDLQAAASKVVDDLPNEVKLTGYTIPDIIDMILGNLPAILGAVNPALGTAAAVIQAAATPAPKP